MKTEEDEAFDDLAKRQGDWGGGFPAKRQAAMDKINSDFDGEYKKMHEDRIKYGTSWSQDGKRIDPMSVYKEPVTERKALKLALEALEADELDMVDDGSGNMVFRKEQAITAIKEALAQPAPQREWVGLTAEEAAECWTTSATQTWKNFEAKLKDKNT